MMANGLDPVGEALAGTEEPDGAVMVDLDQFVTVSGAEDEPDAEEPVVTHDGERGARAYVLLHPPSVDGARLSRVTMRLPEQGDIDDFAAGAISGNRGMICRLTGLHPAVFRRLKWPDAEALHQIYRDIAPGFLTGED